MKFYSILPLVFILILNSCQSDTKKGSSLEEISITSLHKSNKAILNLSNKNYMSLQDKLRKAIYGRNVELWNNKALKLKALTREVIGRVETLREDNNFLIDTINYLKTKYFKEVKLLDTTINNILNENDNEFLVSKGKDLSPAFIIEKTKNDILLFESKWSSSLNNKTDMIIEDFTVFSTLVSQNTKHLKPGETLEITAAIGSFSRAANPTFIFNGIAVKPGEDATAKYNFKVTGKGKKTIPVKIIYISNDGLKKSKEIELDYYVDE